MAEHPRAFVEATLLHLVLALVADRRRWPWTAVSWALAASHLGMLEGRRSLGLPNALTLVRANLPALQDRLGDALVFPALVTDLLDGRIARGTRRETRFGEQADFLADTAVWTWFALRQEKSTRVRAAVITAWGAPVIGVVLTSFARGAMVDVPRSRWIRPAAAMEVLLGASAIARLIRNSPQTRLRRRSSRLTQ